MFSGSPVVTRGQAENAKKLDAFFCNILLRARATFCPLPLRRYVYCNLLYLHLTVSVIHAPLYFCTSNYSCQFRDLVSRHAVPHVFTLPLMLKLNAQQAIRTTIVSLNRPNAANLYYCVSFISILRSLNDVLRRARVK